MTVDATWSRTCHRDINATAQAIWQAFAEVAHWGQWNAGVKSIRLDGPFADGSRFAMELPDGMVIHSLLADVTERQGFTDESRIGDTTVRVVHHIEALQPGRCRVTYAIDTRGPDARETGEAASGDFPEVLAGLARYLGDTTV